LLPVFRTKDTNNCHCHTDPGHALLQPPRRGPFSVEVLPFLFSFSLGRSIVFPIMSCSESCKIFAFFFSGLPAAVLATKPRRPEDQLFLPGNRTIPGYPPGSWNLSSQALGTRLSGLSGNVESRNVRDRLNLRRQTRQQEIILEPSRLKTRKNVSIARRNQ
jgi:hypothetical protein